MSHDDNETSDFINKLFNDSLKKGTVNNFFFSQRFNANLDDEWKEEYYRFLITMDADGELQIVLTLVDDNIRMQIKEDLTTAYETQGFYG